MNVSEEKSISPWMKTKVADAAPALHRDEKAEVVGVGSGIAGMSVAYELAKAGKDVVIIDRGPIGKGMTSRTTAHLTAQCDDGFDQLIGRRGEEIARLWYQRTNPTAPSRSAREMANRRRRCSETRGVSSSAAPRSS